MIQSDNSRVGAELKLYQTKAVKQTTNRYLVYKALLLLYVTLTLTATNSASNTHSAFIGLFYNSDNKQQTFSYNRLDSEIDTCIFC
jgi:hypothetical protein